MLGEDTAASISDGRPTTLRRVWLVLTVTVILAGCSACAVAVDGVGRPAPGRAPEAAAPTTTPQPTTAPPTPTGDDAGELSAPFDVCRTITWADFPAAVRPANPRHEPVPMELEEDDVLVEGCRYDNSEAVEIEICVPPPCQEGYSQG